MAADKWIGVEFNRSLNECLFDERKEGSFDFDCISLLLSLTQQFNILVVIRTRVIVSCRVIFKSRMKYIQSPTKKA